MATNDPNAAAEALAGQTYASAPARTTESKKALLDQLATGGTYQNTIDQSLVAGAAPAAPVSPYNNDSLNQIANQGATQASQFGQQALQAATQLAGASRTAQSEAAGNYFDMAAAAIPVEQSRSQSEAAQIFQQLINEREERAAAAAARAHAQKMRELDLADRAKAESGKNAAGLTPIQAYNQSESMKQTALDGVTGSIADDPAGNRIYNAVLSLANGGSYPSDMTPAERSQVNNYYTQYLKALKSSGYAELTGMPLPISGSQEIAKTNAAGMLGAVSAVPKKLNPNIAKWAIEEAKKAPQKPRKPQTTATGTFAGHSDR